MRCCRNGRRCSAFSVCHVRVFSLSSSTFTHRRTVHSQYRNLPRRQPTRTKRLKRRSPLSSASALCASQLKNFSNEKAPNHDHDTRKTQHIRYLCISITILYGISEIEAGNMQSTSPMSDILTSGFSRGMFLLLFEHRDSLS